MFAPQLFIHCDDAFKHPIPEGSKERGILARATERALYCALSQFVSQVCLFQFSPVLGHFHSCLCKKVKEDKRRAKEQYDAFNKLETVGYCFDRELISSTAAESWTSKREVWIY